MAESIGVDGARIEHLRKVRAGMSRKQAAIALGLSEAGLYMIERKHRTRPSTLLRIAALLKEDPENLATNGAKVRKASATRESA